jgi:outer membrane receptor protein involved in Fe transport
MKKENSLIKRLLPGDDNSRFYLSMQDIYSRSTMPGDKGRRDVFRVGGSRTMGAFNASYSASYTYRTTNTTNTGTVYQMVMNTPAHIPLTRFKDWRNDKFADVNGFYNDYFDNPYFDIDNYRNISTSHNLSGNIELNLKPWKWLNLKYRVAMTNVSSNYEYIQGIKAFSNYAKTDTRVIYSNPNGNGLDTVNEAPKFNVTTAAPAAYQASNSSNFLLTSDFLASIDKKITKNLNLNLTLGTTYIDNKIRGIGVQAASLFVPVYNINNIQGTPTTGGANYFAEANKLGLLSDMLLSWKGWANLHASYRSDLDSRLSHANRFIPYYDVDASIVLSDVVNFIKNSKVLSFAKIRGAYSVTGNASALGGGSQFIASGAYAINPIYIVSGSFPYGNVGGYVLNTSLANPNLKPETVTEKEVAMELGFFQNKYTLSATYYSTELTDGIVPASTSSASGFYSALLNAANVATSGEELELKANILRKKNITLNVNMNYSHFHNQVKSINGNLKSLQIGGNNGNAFAVVGQSYPVIETRDWVRDGDGHVIVDAISGNPSRNSALSILGNATPKDILGITPSFTYKNLTLTATIDYRGGYKIFNSIGQYIDFTGISYVTAVTGRQRFVFPNSVTVDASGKSTPNTNIEVDDANFNFWPGLYRSVGANYVTSASAWKLRELALAYDLPRKWYSATKVIQKATFSISGRNLFMLRPKTNEWTDPEFSEDAGNDVGRNGTGQAPPTRIFSATLSVSF